MIYEPAHTDSLAAEYVLGTLQGPARRRFEKLIAERATVRATVWHWERRLNCIAAGVGPRRPPRRVWKNIRSRIKRPQGTHTSWFGRGFWLGFPAAVATSWLAISYIPQPAPDRLAVFTDQDSKTLWVVSADLDDGMLKTEAVGSIARQDNQAYELWILPAEGPPLSLGLLPVDTRSLESPLSPAALAALPNATGLAISLEPEGGSPTGLPTGPVVYQASLVEI